MRTHRVFVPEYNTNAAVELTGEAQHYLGRVLRIKPNQHILIFDSKGQEHLTRVSDLQKKSLTLEIIEASPIVPQSPLSITLIQGVSKGDRMDTVVQKATELGVTRIIPALCEFNAVKLDEKRWQKKLEHWQQIAVSACEQSMRHYLPEITAPITLSKVLEQEDAACRLILHPANASLTSQLVENTTSIALAIGPEGGFSEHEVAQATKNGWKSVGLGPRILRTETAAIAAVASIQMRLGDLA